MDASVCFFSQLDPPDTASRKLSGAIVGMILVSVIGSIEQSTEFGFGAFPSSCHRQHIQIEKLTENLAPVSGTTISTISSLPFPGIARRQFLRILIARRSSQS